MSRGRKLMANFGIFGVATLGTQVVSFVMVPVYTHALPPDEFGTVELVVTAAALLLPLVSMAVSEALLRFVMSPDEDRVTVTTNAVALGAVGAAFFLATYPVAALLGVLPGLLAYAYTVVVIQLFHSIASQHTRATGRIKTFAAAGILQALILGGSNIVLLVHFDLGAAGFLASISLSSLVAAAFMTLSSKIFRDIRPRVLGVSVMKRLLAYSVPLIPNSALWWLVVSANRYFVLLFAGVGAVGVFGIANKVPLLLAALTSVFSQAWQLSAFETHTDADRDTYHSRALTYYSVVLLIGCSGVLLVTKPLYSVFFNEKYAEGWKYVPFLLIAMALSSVSTFLGTAYTAAKQTRGALKTSAAAAALAVLLNVVLIPWWGAFGAAIATMLAFAALVIHRLVDTRRFIRLTLDPAFIGSALCILALQSLAMYAGLPPLAESVTTVALFVLLVVRARRPLAEMLHVLAPRAKRQQT